MRRLDRLSVAFFDFNVPALTPRHHRIYSALEFCKNKPLLAICHRKADAVGKGD
jgi:hypothetical protein